MLPKFFIPFGVKKVSQLGSLRLKNATEWIEGSSLSFSIYLITDKKEEATFWFESWKDIKKTLRREPQLLTSLYIQLKKGTLPPKLKEALKNSDLNRILMDKKFEEPTPTRLLVEKRKEAPKEVIEELENQNRKILLVEKEKEVNIEKLTKKKLRRL
jgi:hypothetical protein